MILKKKGSANICFSKMCSPLKSGSVYMCEWLLSVYVYALKIKIKDQTDNKLTKHLIVLL